MLRITTGQVEFPSIACPPIFEICLMRDTRIELALTACPVTKICTDNLRVAGIEPASLAWEANVLPLNHTRANAQCKFSAGLGKLVILYVPIPKAIPTEFSLSLFG